MDVVKQTYVPGRRPPYQVYLEIFATKQELPRETGIFITKKRKLLAELPVRHSEETEIDMIYGLLHSEIRTEMRREDVAKFTDILLKLRNIENIIEERKSYGSEDGMVSTPIENASVCDEKVPVVQGQSNLETPVKESNEVSKINEITLPTNMNWCTNCHIFGHLDVYCWRKPDELKRKQARNEDLIHDIMRKKSTYVRCSNCNKTGHRFEECRKVPDNIKTNASQMPYPLLYVKCFGCNMPGVKRPVCPNCAPGKNPSTSSAGAAAYGSKSAD